MSTASVNKAIATYQAATTPAAVQKAVRAAKRCGHSWFNAAVVRQSAADELRDSLEVVR